MSLNIEHSRALKLGSSATGVSVEMLKQRLEHALITIRVAPGLPGALLAARVLLTTLSRLPGELALDRTGLTQSQVDELRSAAHNIDSTRPLRIVDGAPPDSAINILLGTTPTAGWLRVVPEGYGAHLLADDAAELRQTRPGNALGSVFAAAVAAAEAFKFTANVLESRCIHHREFSYCPVTLSADTAAAPAIALGTTVDTAIIGNGAIGTAEALILSEFAFGGHIIVCDPETFSPENRGTYSLGGEHEARARLPKVDITAAALEASGYSVTKVEGKSTDLIARVDAGDIRLPTAVLTALDSAEARRETQDLWADHIIDSQTGDTAAGLCVSVPTGPCLHCFFPPASRGASTLDGLAELTGLSVSRLRRGDDPLTEADLAELSVEQRELLQTHLGQPVCGLADAIGLTDADADGYMPSVPFVSQIAACLGVGRLLALVLGVEAPGNWLQFDALVGPHAPAEHWNARPACQCRTRSVAIAKVRALRQRFD